MEKSERTEGTELSDLTEHERHHRRGDKADTQTGHGDDAGQRGERSHYRESLNTIKVPRTRVLLPDAETVTAVVHVADRARSERMRNDQRPQKCQPAPQSYLQKLIAPALPMRIRTSPRQLKRHSQS